MGEAFPVVLLFLLGMSLGSFFNVCIHRIPRKVSIVRPSSHCPRCGSSIRPFDNIPILSYIILRGRCRSCGQRISPQYPIVELGAGVMLAGLYNKFGLRMEFLIFAILSSLLIVVFFIDYNHRVIPDSISIPGIVLGLGLSFIPGGLSPLSSLLGVAVGGALLASIAFFGRAVFRKEAMGGGDVKLAAMVGAFLGWKLLILSVFVASFLGALVGITLIILRLKSRSSPIPFGPFIAIGSLTSVFWGKWLIQTYLGIFV